MAKADHLPPMSILTPIPPATPPLQRALFSIPILGWFARDIAFGDPDNLYYFLIILLTATVLSVMTWGLPALVVKALLYVPVHVVLMVALSWPYPARSARASHSSSAAERVA